MKRFCSILILLGLCANAVPAAQLKFPDQTFTVPDGFEVEAVTTRDLVQRPVSGSFDELGRLYVTDSSGSNAKPAAQLADPTHRIVRLEDTDDDGRFDKSVVFADKVMFPEGCLYYDGSVYIAAPPSIWKLTDTNNDGVADVRVEWHQGKTLTGCANDLHGPYLGPDGWIYWCKGAFAEQSYEVDGKPFTSRAAHIFRARPDHSGLEPVMTGGMDNPVGLAFTPEGERIMCGTFFAPHEPGHRDGLIHAIYGGVYGKINPVTDSHIKTGDLMPVMTHMGPAAPAAVIRYESKVFGVEYRDNLFCCQFNLHKVSRHILEPQGATYKTKDSDFLVSDNTDFHPTDVIEDADGSLLVLDTGPWYKLCCPTSQLAKPDVLGAIYRIRRKGASKVADPSGLRLAWGTLKPAQLATLLGDQRPAVVKRAIQQLGKGGAGVADALGQLLATSGSVEMRRNAVWCLTRLDDAKARALLKNAFRDEESVAHAAIHAANVGRNPQFSSLFQEQLLNTNRPQLQRSAAEALGRIHDAATISELFEAIGQAAPDRVLEHSVIYALIQIGAVKETARFVDSDKPAVRRAALIALDQMENGGLKPEMVAELFTSPDASLRKTAAWIASHHADWGSALAGVFQKRLIESKLTDADRTELQRQLATFAGDEAIQNVIVSSLNDPATSVPIRRMLLGVMADAGLERAPKSWPPAVNAALDSKEIRLKRAGIVAARALGRAKHAAPDFSDKLQRIALDASQPDDLRLDALAALPRGLKNVEPGLLDFLLQSVDPAKPVSMRGAAASALTKAGLVPDQLIRLTDTLKATGPLEVSRLLAAFEHSTNEAVGLKLIAALKESKGQSGARPDALRTLAAKYSPAVQQKAEELLATLNVDAEKQKAHIDDLLATLPKGEVRRGQALFNSPKAACSSCHKIGYGGGTVGPDLTAIGPARTVRDLLEAIVYPSASFVRSYEPFIVHTQTDEDYSGVLRKETADEIVLATGPNAEVRLSRAEVAEMRPGTVSVMPGGLDQLLSRQELADIVAFLKNTQWGPN